MDRKPTGTIPMLPPCQDRAERAHHPATAEQVSWMVVIAAEQLAAEQPARVDRARYIEAARRMRYAVRWRWSDEVALRAASPTITEADGRSCTLVDGISRFYEDPDAGVREAVACFLAFDWQAAA